MNVNGQKTVVKKKKEIIRSDLHKKIKVCSALKSGPKKTKES